MWQAVIDLVERLAPKDGDKKPAGDAKSDAENAKKDPGAAKADAGAAKDTAGAAAASGDPYAASRASIRETVKWLITIFSAFAAWIVGGVSVSNLGGLFAKEASAQQAWLAVAALVVAFVFILFCICEAVLLLRPMIVYLHDAIPKGPDALASGTADVLGEKSWLEQRAFAKMRKRIAEHQSDWSPLGYRCVTYEQLLKTADRLDEIISDPTLSAEKRADARKEYEGELIPFFLRVQSFGSYLVLSILFNWAMLRVAVYASVTFAALTAFAILGKGGSAPAAPATSTVTLVVKGADVATAPDTAPTPPPFGVSALEFDAGSDALSPASATLLRTVAAWLKANPDAAVVLHSLAVAAGGQGASLQARRVAAIRAMVSGQSAGSQSRVFEGEAAPVDAAAGGKTPPDRIEVTPFWMASKKAQTP